MKRYFLKQLIMIIPTLFLVTVLSFVLIRMMPTDAVDAYLLIHHLPKTEQNIELAEERLGLDEPVTEQYVQWLGDIVHLDFGKTYSTGQDVAPMLWSAFLNTLKLALASMIWIVIMTPILGIGASAKSGKLMDKATRVYCLCGTAIPTFVLGFILIRLFAVKMGILPVVSDGSLKCLILPSFTLSLSHIAYFVQMLRNEMLQNRSEQFVLYAKARGISEKKIFRTHLLKNSIQPLVNTVGISIGGLIAGTVIVENVFSWPGLGRLITKAILARDYPVIQGYILIVAVTYIVANMLSDMMSVIVDPRIRLGKGDVS
jgi:ABC-type dipeptide/oligopeptide/nickel transport system permease component